ncbi:hypothetical protein AADW59_00745 [Candidatus Hodgkinia cicadicola]
MHSCGHNTASVEFSPLISGMGQTVANALRRTLLTCVNGWALVGVRLDGAEHMLSKLNGVKEDVVDIVLNLEQLVFAGEADATIIKGVLAAFSEGDVLAYNVCLPNGISVLNLNQRICYLNANSKVRAELVIMRGAGYLSSEAIRAKLGQHLEGYIVLDANFSPIKRVSYRITEPEYNFKSYDKVSMLIESNGAIKLCATIKSVCRFLCDHFSSLAEAF